MVRPLSPSLKPTAEETAAKQAEEQAKEAEKAEVTTKLNEIIGKLDQQKIDLDAIKAKVDEPKP